MKGIHSLIAVILLTSMFIVNVADDVPYFILGFSLSFGILDLCSTEGVMLCTTQRDNSSSFHKLFRIELLMLGTQFS